MNIGRFIRLGQSQHVRSALTWRSEARSWLRPAASISTPKRSIFVELDQKDTPVIGSPTENRLKDINFPPFLKSLYCGEFNRSVLSYADVISYDRYYVLQEQIEQIRKIMAENKETIDSIEERGVVPDQLLKKLQSLELTGLLIPRKYGGAELLKSEAVRLYQELGQSFTLAELFRINELMCTRGIVLYGTEDQKVKYLEKISAGDLWTATCITEKNAGSDPLSIETLGTLDETGTKYHLKGTKTWVANAIRANLFLVFAQVKCHDYLGNIETNLTAFLVDRDTPGVEISKPYHLSALNGLQVCDVSLDCQLPTSAVLGDPGEAQKIYQSINHDIKFFMAGAVVARLRKLMDATVKHCLSRRQYGNKLAGFELINIQIARASSYIFALESMIYLTAGLADVGESPDTEMESAVVKEFAVIASDIVTKLCLSLVGAQANLVGSEYNKYIAENQVLQAWQGTSNVSKCFIGITGILGIVELKGEEMSKYLQPKLNPFLLMAHTHRVWRENNKIFPKRYKIDGNVHPRLGNVAMKVDEAAIRLSVIAEMMLKHHGLNVQVHERNLELLANFTIEVYAMVSVLARTSRSYCVGHPHANLEIDLAIPFIADSKRRIDSMFEDFLRMSEHKEFSDCFYMNAGEYMFKQGEYCPVNPLTKNTF
jgi:acyl-CoA dehydrogenase family protein 9